jgi:hypothetical protein
MPCSPTSQESWLEHWVERRDIAVQISDFYAYSPVKAVTRSMAKEDGRINIADAAAPW